MRHAVCHSGLLLLATLGSGCEADGPRSDTGSSGPIPDEEPCTPSTWFRDADGDGFGDAFEAVEGCPAPTGYVADDTDCDDTDPEAVPGTTWYPDVDGDGFGDPSMPLESCARPEGHILLADDCDDWDSSRSPASDWYADADGDGFGDPDAPVPSCEAATGDVPDDRDCDDTDPDVHPLATEVCDFIDNDCNGLLDDDDPAVELRTRVPLFTDADGDGWGTDEYIGDFCPSSGLGAEVRGDCDDTNPAVNPDMLELPDALDQNCDGDETYHRLETLPDQIGNDTVEEFATGLWSADLDGDADRDLLIGAPGAAAETGRLLWWDDSGPTDGSVPTTTRATWTGTAEGSRVGSVVLPLGDVDGDGVQDLLVTDFGAAGAEPAVHLLSVDTPSGPLSDGTWAWTLGAGDSGFGTAMVHLGDIDADGQAELLISAPEHSEAAAWSGEGAVFVVDASDIDTRSDPREGPYVLGAWRNYNLGRSMARIEDADGDGIAEALVGAWRAYAPGPASGAAYLLTAADLDVSGFASEDAFTIGGVDTGLNAGRHVGSLGDLDGDGYGDLAVSSNTHDDATGRGTLHLFYGRVDLFAANMTVQDDDARLLSLRPSDEVGTGVHPVPDFDGDGQDDVIIANAHTDFPNTAGEVRSWYDHGALYGIPGQRLSGSLDMEAPAAWAVRATGTLVRAGVAVTRAGDRDGDGLGDIWIGATDASPYEGRVYLFSTGALP